MLNSAGKPYTRFSCLREGNVCLCAECPKEFLAIVLKDSATNTCSEVIKCLPKIIRALHYGIIFTERRGNGCVPLSNGFPTPLTVATKGCLPQFPGLSIRCLTYHSHISISRLVFRNASKHPFAKIGCQGWVNSVWAAFFNISLPYNAVSSWPCNYERSDLIIGKGGRFTQKIGSNIYGVSRLAPKGRITLDIDWHITEMEHRKTYGPRNQSLAFFTRREECLR